MKARLLLLTIVLLARPAGADIVVTAGQRYFGRVVTQTADAVVFDGACKRENRASIRRADVEAIIINRRICNEGPVRLPRAGMQGACDTTRIEAFEIAWKAGGAIVARDFRIRNDRLHADADAKGSIHGPLDDVHFIRRRTICPKVLDDQELKVPPSFCIEPKRWAVNFSFAPVFNNTIFTRAFTVYTESDDAPPAAVAAARQELIVKAFGSAVLYWTAALHDARKDLAGPVAAYVDSIISKGSNIQLLSPPQAVPAACPDFGTIHVRWLTKGEQLFPIRHDYVAMAQVEGRTVVLNARDFAFAWSLDPKAVPAGRTNLIHVLVHELGHCLGLDHAPPAETSVMADALDRMPLMPTSRDAASLVRILGAHVEGAPAGEFDATSCTGLRAKSKH